MIDALLWIGVALSYLIGTFFALDALWQGRTSQTTLAWVLGLVFLPFISVPLYAFFGSRRFHGYIRARRHGHEELDLLAQQAIEKLEPWKQPPRELTKPLIPLFFSAPVDGNRSEEHTSELQSRPHLVCRLLLEKKKKKKQLR